MLAFDGRFGARFFMDFQVYNRQHDFGATFGMMPVRIRGSDLNGENK